jgi:putative DNA primase/helicase
MIAPSLKAIARALGGEVVGGQVLAPGPGHSRSDRSLGVKLSGSSLGGFLVHSFAGDDWHLCRDYVSQQLGLPRGTGSHWRAEIRRRPVEPRRDIERTLGHSLSREMEGARQRPEAASVRRRPDCPRPLRIQSRALKLWLRAALIDGTPADLYLRARGFTPPYPATLRFLPARTNHPHALIAALGLPTEPEPGLSHILDAAVRAVHLTRLDPSGISRLKTRDAKIIVGRGALGFPAALTPVRDGLGLLIAEGIENGLSLGKSLGIGAWAACSHTRMPALADAVPRYVEAVTIVADPEPQARNSARALAEQLERRGFAVTVRVMGEAV